MNQCTNLRTGELVIYGTGKPNTSIRARCSQRKHLQMRRVLVVGSGGSGKSTFSVTLGRILGLPVHHLDRLYWKPGWQKPDARTFQSTLLDIVNDDAWILDGNYRRTFDLRAARADTVIYLDMPTITCMTGILARRLNARHRSRPDLPSGNMDRLTFDFVVYVLTFRILKRPELVRRLAELPSGIEVVKLASRKAADEWLEELAMEI